MERIRATAALDTPQADAEQFLPRFFEERRTSAGFIVMNLRVPLEDFGLGGDLAVAREVEVRVEKRRDEDNLNDVYGISWSPKGGGPFPDFEGQLYVWSEDDPTSAYLDLDGTYEPPLGKVFGEAFDAAIGHLIAQRTAKSFVEEVAEGISAIRTRVLIERR